MLTRRKFIQTIGGAVTLTAAPMLLESCATGLATYRGKFDGKMITIPHSEAAALAAPNGVMLVRAPNFPIAIALRRLEGKGLIALSTVCTHKGCEVRLLPDALECPCHGSAYALDGAVVEGPATQPLQRFAVTENSEAIIIQVKA
ncbi:MAG: Cytochrome b6-f complex iron-sulfur subunit [bacterium]|nr:Cytochrome b6-f complex iron-sulfur subunit [bacterium]